tara:strand:- start:55 stop:960 length:906 start_codon:yes stop_codon:yes gene_type:complete
MLDLISGQYYTMTQLIQGDCIDKMKDIEDDSVNLILTDPPYNICHRDLDWDKIDNYIEFMIKVFAEAYRVLTKNGSLYFFHNDFKQIATLQIAIEKQTNFRFQRFITITKDSYITKQYPNSKSWINCCEYILVYTKHENREIKQIGYFQSLLKIIGKSKAQIKKDIPLTDHAFRISINNFSLPTQETYDKMIELYNLKDCKSLEELRTFREPLLYTYNGKSQPNYLHANFKKGKKTTHPCEKPQEILLNLINTASNENDIVLDMFMGCGSTGIACKSSNRHFIGIELDPQYFEEAKERIEV